MAGVECSKVGEQIFMMKSVDSDDLVQSVDQKFCERQQFTISELLCEFPVISCTVLCEIITVRLGYHKFCVTLVPKMQGMASIFTFF
jgi:hypothetical protein